MTLPRLDPRLQTQLVDAYLDLIPLVMFNVIWFMVSLPVVTAIPATAGLFYVTNKISHGQRVEWQDFFRGMRFYFLQSWLWGALNLLVVAVLVSNNVYYAANPSAFAGIARGIVLTLGLAWLCVQLYMFPLLMEQERPRLGLALRNSLVITLKRPTYSLRIAIWIFVVAFFTTALIWPLWIVLSAAYCARTANNATITSIARISGPKAIPEVSQENTP
jgi:uncharacterized membrane protein YesL